MGDQGNLVHRVDELESRNAIAELAFNYCHGFDKREFERFLSIWWEDCVWDIGPPFGHFSGHEGVREAVLKVLWPAWSQTQHVTSNLVIEFHDPDSARAICDVDCMGLLTDSSDATFVGATYYDELRRRNGVWKIAQRAVTIHYLNGFPGTRLTPPEA